MILNTKGGVDNQEIQKGEIKMVPTGKKSHGQRHTLYGWVSIT